MSSNRKSLKIKLAGLAGALLVVLALLTGEVFSQELKIERKERLAPSLQDTGVIQQGWVEVGDGLHKGRFKVPRSFLNIYRGGGGGAGAAADPFADPPLDPSDKSTMATAKEVLEELGVVFGKGSKVVYNHRTSILTVVEKRDQLELVEAYFSYGCRRTPRQIAIRAEIYELPSHLALEVVESCQAEGDHTAERNAVLKLVKEGHARLVAMPALIARSGQRARITDAVGLSYPEKVDVKTGEDQNKAITFKTQAVGTIFEVDPVLGADEWTVDVSIRLEHHTAPPVLGLIANQMQTPQAHNKEILTQLVLYKGNYLLIGTWKPTGKPEYQEKDLTHVVFLTVNVQNQGEYGLLESADEEDPKDK